MSCGNGRAGSLAGDPQLRRSSHQPVWPARPQVGEHFGLAV